MNLDQMLVVQLKNQDASALLRALFLSIFVLEVSVLSTSVVNTRLISSDVYDCSTVDRKREGRMKYKNITYCRCRR